MFPKLGENTLSGNVVREIHQDDNGNLWIGTEDAGLNKYDTATKIFTHFQPEGNSTSISSTNIHGLFVDGNELLIGTFENGMDILWLPPKFLSRILLDHVCSRIHSTHTNQFRIIVSHTVKEIN